MRSRLELVAETAEEYRKASKKDKGKMLDNLTKLTGYNRDYVCHLLNLCRGKTMFTRQGDRVIRARADFKLRRRRNRKKTYGPEVLQALKTIWAIMDMPCGKRLVPCMEWLVPRLEQVGELSVTPEVRQKLLSMSASTVDRLLSQERRKLAGKGRSLTKPGTLLKHQIPIRTFAQWDDARPGFTEMDLVDHGGGNTKGQYVFSLTVTDIATGWTEMRAVKNKAQKWVFEALKLIVTRLPFPLLGIDSDNDSAFINNHLRRFCEANKVTFTRIRPGRKNDNCYVEQKNWSVIRRNAGYARYESDKELELLNRMYDLLRLYQNFFQPSMKLESKERDGAKVTRRYDQAMTPYHRVLASDYVEESVKAGLTQVFNTLNPAELKRQITRLQELLQEESARPKSLAGDVAVAQSASFT
jgi:hypothetical protein